MERKYLSSVNFLRGLAALAVCLAHFTNGNSRYLSPHNFLRIAGGYGNYGVHIFFVISGLVIPLSMHKGNYLIKNFKKFLIKRIIRIEPPYLISILVVLVLTYLSTLAPYYRGKPFYIDLVALLCHLAYLNSFFHFQWINPVYWTLAIEFQYYITIALIFPLLSSYKALHWLSTIIVFNLFVLIIPGTPFIFYYAFYFTLGIVVYKFLVNEINKQNYYLVITILFVLIFLKFGLAGLVAGLIPVLFLFTSWENKICRFLGNISYSLYLLHIPFGMRVINLSEIFFKSESSRVLMLFAALVFTVAVSYLFYLYAELPFKKISHRIKYQNSKGELVVHT